MMASAQIRPYTVYLYYAVVDGVVEHKRFGGIQGVSKTHAVAIAKAVASEEHHIKAWDLVGVHIKEE